MAKYPAKALPDPNGGHIRLYWTVFDSPAWKALTPQQRFAYIAIQRFLNSSNNGTLHLTLKEAKHAGIKSSATLAKALRNLVAVGLLSVTREGGCERDGERLPTLYAVTHLPVYDQPRHMVEARKPTHDWKGVASISHARCLIRQANERAKEGHEKRKTKTALQKLAPTPSAIEAVARETRSKIKSSPAGAGSKNEARKVVQIVRKSNYIKGFRDSPDSLDRGQRASKTEDNVLDATPIATFGDFCKSDTPAETLIELFERLTAATGAGVRGRPLSGMRDLTEAAA